MNAKDFPNTTAMFKRIQKDHMDILGDLLDSHDWTPGPCGSQSQWVGNLLYIVNADGRIELAEL